MGGPEQNGGTELKAGALGFWDCVMMAVGGMVGMAIFSLSGVTFSLSGPASLLAWVVGGAILFLYAMNVAEMATKFPRAGGVFVYPAECLGRTAATRDFWAWLAAWSWINVTVLGTAFGAIFIAQYLSGIIPGAAPHVVPLGVLWVALVWLLNVLGITLMGKTNLILTALLVIICLVYVGYAFGAFNPAMLSPFFAGFLGVKGFYASIPISMLAYGSVIAISAAAEEIREPRKTIPKAMATALIATVVLYALILVSTYGVIPWQQVTEGSFGFYAPLHFAIAIFAPDKPWLMALISVAALLAITTTMLVMVMDAGRTLLAIGRSGILPKQFASVNPSTRTPVLSLTVVAIASAIVACFPGFTMQIIGTGSLTFGILVAIMVFSVIGSRVYRKDVQGTFVTPGGYTLQVLTLAVLVFVLSQLGRDALVLSGWWYLIGLVYFGLRYVTKPDLFKDAKG
ncbi:MAG: APC family permease [Bacillota bacterium]